MYSALVFGSLAIAGLVRAKSISRVTMRIIYPSMTSARSTEVYNCVPSGFPMTMKTWDPIKTVHEGIFCCHILLQKRNKLFMFYQIFMFHRSFNFRDIFSPETDALT